MKTRLAGMLVIGLSVLLFSIPLSARDWTDSTGQYKVEGDLLKIEPDRVQLMKTDGTEIWVPIARLSKADRAFVKSQLEKEPAGAEALPIELKVEGLAQWSKTIRVGVDGKEKQLPPDLEIQVIITGKAVAEVVAIGIVEIESVRDAAGKRIELAEPLEMGMLKRDFIGMDDSSMRRRYLRRPEGHPKDGVLLAIPVKVMPQTKMIGHAKGSVTLKTGGEHQSVAVNIAAAEIDKPIHDESLAATGLKVTVRKFERRQIQFQITEGRSNVTNLSLVDATGREIGLQGDAANFRANDGTYTFMSLQPLPADAAIRIDVMTGVKEVVVPFSLEKLTVPKMEGAGVMFQF